MLTVLRVNNLALLEKIDITFGPGFNVLTGETGAGKSILIDAVGLLCGSRGQIDLIRSGAEKALVEGCFELPVESAARETISAMGLGEDTDEQVILQREINIGGKNTCRINGRPVTLAMFKAVGNRLVDIYGQHDDHSLLDPGQHLKLLDRFGGEGLLAQREEVTLLYRKLQATAAELQALAAGEKAEREKEFLAFQLQEIDQAGLQAGEEEELRSRLQLLNQGEKLANALYVAVEALYDGAGGKNIYDLLTRAVGAVKPFATLQRELGEAAEILDGILIQAAEQSRVLRNMAENLDFNQGQSDRVADRLDQIQKLKRKYGSAVAEILAYREQVAADLDRMEHARELELKLKAEQEQHLAEYYRVAKILSDRRQKVAADLEQAVAAELADLGMAATILTIRFQTKEPAADGSDAVEILIAPNPGEPLKPLAKIASGGEMARIMLALKTVLARSDQIPTMIFDEADSGIGGRTLVAVAEKMARIGSCHQVLCVTHAAQVASYADRHFIIQKEINSNRTVTTVQELNQPGQVRELARMLSGAEGSQVGETHASAMLTAAKNRKKESGVRSQESE